MLELYHSEPNTFFLKPLIALHEKRAAFQSRWFDADALEHFTTNFPDEVESRLHHKDIHIVLDLARKFGIELPACAAAADVLDRLQQRGGARQDSAAIFNVLNSE